jgi:hypothetical protein
MKNLIASLAAFAGVATSATAALSQLSILASKDGSAWSDHLIVDQGAGDSGQVYIAYVLSYVPQSQGEITPDAFASVTFQPVFANVRTGVDTINPFANTGNNVNGGAIDARASYGAGTGGYGRIKPWAATGPSSTQSYVAHSHTANSGGAPAGSYYRIARNDVTNWFGLGATTGTAASNNFNGAGGVVVGQKQNPAAGIDPARVSGTQGLLLMVLSMQTGPTASSFDIACGAPLEGMSRNSTTGAREANWYANTTELAASIKVQMAVTGAMITVIPAPGTLAVLGMAGFFAGRRRR